MCLTCKTQYSILILTRSRARDAKNVMEALEMNRRTLIVAASLCAAVGVIVDAVHKNGGALIKFLGDAVFAVFDDVQVRRSNIPLGW